MSQQASWSLPDPLLMADGSPVTSPEAWFRRRRPELAAAGYPVTGNKL